MQSEVQALATTQVALLAQVATHENTQAALLARMAALEGGRADSAVVQEALIELIVQVAYRQQEELTHGTAGSTNQPAVALAVGVLVGLVGEEGEAAGQV